MKKQRIFSIIFAVSMSFPMKSDELADKGIKAVYSHWTDVRQLVESVSKDDKTNTETRKHHINISCTLWFKNAPERGYPCIVGFYYEEKKYNCVY